MCYLKTLHVYFLTCLLLLLTACDKSDESIITTVQDPEIVAIAFFNALYNEKNVKKAASVCSPKMARLLLHYRSSAAVGRHLFNMSYDNVRIKPDTSGVKLRKQFSDSAQITVYFDGYHNESRIKDVKRLAIIQKGGKWFIDEVLKDPF
ncbi:MAG: hypothetical protein V5789_11720 [Colwellia sp.]